MKKIKSLKKNALNESIKSEKPLASAFSEVWGLSHAT